jgi:hypothetical protein
VGLFEHSLSSSKSVSSHNEPFEALAVLQLNPAGGAPMAVEVMMLVQKALLLVPLMPCQSKSPSTLNTKAPN